MTQAKSTNKFYITTLKMQSNFQIACLRVLKMK